MVFVQRDEKGRVLRVEHEPFDSMTQRMPAHDPEVQTWFASRCLHDHLMSLQHSDLELVRVLEDLVQVLVERGLMNYTDLPDPARQKLQNRAYTRAQVGDLGDLVMDEMQLPY